MNLLKTLTCGLLCAVVFSARAVDEPDKEYVRIYRLIQEADLLRQSRQEQPALEKFNESKAALEKLQQENPDWYAKVVQFRLNYVNDRLKQMAAGGGTRPAGQPLITPPSGRSTEAEQQLATLAAEMTKLRAEKTELETRLRDAQLTTATTAGRELARAEEKVRGLQRENDALKADIEQRQKRINTMVDPSRLEEAQKSLAEASRKLEEQSKTNASLGSLATVNEQLRKQLAEAAERQNAESEKSRQAQQQVDKLKADLTALDSQLKQAQGDASRAALLKQQQQKVAELEKQLLELPPLKAANEQLQKQLADAETRRAAQEQSLTTAQADLENQKRRAQTLETQQAEAAQKAAAAKKQLDDLKGQMEAGAAATMAANEQLKRQLAEAEIRRAAQEQSLQRGQADLEAQKKLVQTLESQQADEARKAVAAQKQLDDLKAQMAAGAASTLAAGEQVKKQLAEAETRRAAAEQSMSQARADLAAQRKLAESLEKRQAEEIRKAALAQKQLDQIQRQLADSDQRRVEQERSLAQARKDLAAQQALVKSLESGKAEQDQQIAQAQKELAQLKLDKADLQKRIAEAAAKTGGMVARDELAKSEAKLRQLQTENEQLKKTLKDQQAQAGSLISRAEFEAVQKALAEANKTIAAQEKSQAALDSAAQTLRLQTAELKKADAARAEAEERATGLARELEKTRVDLATQQSLAARQEAERRQQADKLKENAKEISRLNKERAEMEARLRELRPGVFPDAGEMVKLEQRAASLKTENDSLRAEIAQQQLRASRMVDVSQLEAAQNSLADANRRLAEQNKSLAQLGSLQSANENLRRQLVEMARNRDGRSRPETSASDPAAGVQSARAELATQERLIRQLRSEKESLASELEKAYRQFVEARKSPGTKPAVDSGSTASRKGDSEGVRQIATATARVKSLESENRRLLVERNSIAEELLKSDKAMLEARDTSRSLGERVRTLEQSAAELRRKLDESYKQQPKSAKPLAAAAPAPGREDVDALRACVATLEARPVPFTAEELKLMSEPTPREALKGVHAGRKSAKDYSVLDWPEVSDSERAFNDGRFADAERKYKLALAREEKSVFLLASLAGAQIEQGRLAEAEANLQRALALDRDDPASLTALGIVRLHQNRFDEALDALSRAAKHDPKNASTQNFLGVALSQKGQRGPAETALRRAVELQPGNPVAHNNLAVVYATQNPPYLELARWHYQKAITGGHRQNPELEKILSGR